MNIKNLELNSLALKFKILNHQCELYLLDQTLLPENEVWLSIQSTTEMIEAIQKLRVRGAPLIGVSASLHLAWLAINKTALVDLKSAAESLYQARPTAVNLMNCINHFKNIFSQDISLNQMHEQTIEKAVQIFNEDVKLCELISANAQPLIKDGDQIITHCNTGGLATAGLGTALGCIVKAHQSGKKIHVYVDETRPLLQGGRLTAWELKKYNIPMTLICDNMAAHLMQKNKITKAFVGSDRIAQNGDFANKIGTYSLAVNCFYHQVPFYVAAPQTTIDYACPSGENIPIEERSSSEISHFFSQVYNPAFDVTPAKLISGWILDHGLFTQRDIDQGIFKK